ncbi:glycoside hydrolase [Phocaeicola plebeius]|uniref:glycoside hydrolase n=1 Tax=Phocaeicola plebeius TaxID=310297 RepID=UPI0029431529|nr:glycoside hydrolase [Phocaeicola plebeius]
MKFQRYAKLILACGMLQGVLSLPAQPTGSITLRCNDLRQTIDGFGVGEADWADDIFIFPKREQVLDALFAPDGLNANILRGEIFPHYATGKLQADFATASDTSLHVAQHPEKVERNDLLRRGQFWLTSHVQQKYPEVRFTFSTWSPPAWMKDGNRATELYPASQGKLKSEHYQHYADYLADFCEAYNKAGIPIYAVSPSNEPGYAAPWNSCLWTPQEMGDFIQHNLLPTLQKRNLKVKVLFGENPAWSTVFDRLKMISSADFVNNVLQTHADMPEKNIIAAGHGYVLPDTIPLPAELRRTPIVPFEEALKRNIPMWVTEISDITPLDVSMEDGLRWATAFHEYLMEAQVSAIIWWLGAQPTKTNESLIVLNQQEGSFIKTKRYDTFGNYTRYIPRGSRGMGNQPNGLPEEVKVSSFRYGNQFTIVVVNPTDRQLTSQLLLENGKVVKGSLRNYITTADKQWSEGTITGSTLEFLPQSVTTFTGEIQ